MDLIKHAIDIFLHLDKYLNDVLLHYGLWTYGILFAIVFFETALVVTPFLPGDSLLFAAGALTVATPTITTPLNFWWTFVLLTAAAVIGDAVNYSIGNYLGPKFVETANGRFIKREHIERTHKFYEKYGKMTIILARFVPIVRTFAPFMAGVGQMRYIEFATYNVVGGVLWVFLGLGAGRLFGGIQFVREHFSLVVIGIVIVSLLPLVYEYWKHKCELKRELASAAAGTKLGEAAKRASERDKECV